MRKSIIYLVTAIIVMMAVANLMGIYFRSEFCPYGQSVPDNIPCNLNHTKVNITDPSSYVCRLFHGTYDTASIYSVCIDTTTNVVVDRAYACDLSVNYCESYLDFWTFITGTIMGMIGLIVELIAIVFILSLWGLPEIMTNLYGSIINTQMKMNIFFAISVIISVSLFIPTNYMLISLSIDSFDPSNFKCSFYQSCLVYDRTKPDNCYKSSEMCYTRDFALLQLYFIGILLVSTCFSWIFMTGIVLGLRIISSIRHGKWRRTQNIEMNKYFKDAENTVDQIRWTMLEEKPLLNETENQ